MSNNVVAPQRRLNAILRSLATTAQPELGRVTIGDVSTAVLESATPSRLPLLRDSLSITDAFNIEHLRWMLQKTVLGQDIFLIGPPGAYARRLALTLCRVLNQEFELVSLHRDVGESELKQGREIREGGTLEYVDSATMRAVKEGRILILEGIEKAERGILPLLNNLLENRELNAEDGTQIVDIGRWNTIQEARQNGDAPADDTVFIPAHPAFRVIAIGTPVPPFKGYPLDPPFRSRFQVRYIDPLGAALALARQSATSPGDDGASPADGRFHDADASWFWDRVRDVVVSAQLASESQNTLSALSSGTSGGSLPPFPQTSLARLSRFVGTFPPPRGTNKLSADALARLFLTLHPGLSYAKFQGFAALSEQAEEAELGPLGNPGVATKTGEGLLGYHLVGIVRLDDSHARLRFENLHDGRLVAIVAPCGPKDFVPVRDVLDNKSPTGPLYTKRFYHMLNCFLQFHAIGLDVSLVPPAVAASPSSSSSLLIDTFAGLLGYDLETIHLYKELGGRELLMRRRVLEGGVTTWEPSQLVKAAMQGKLVHLSSVDALGPTFGSLARLFQDREAELWEGRRIVAQDPPAQADPEGSALLSRAHPSFRIVFTASKATQLRDWLTEEVVNMGMPLPAIALSSAEEAEILRRTGCSEHGVDKLLDFARRYRDMVAAEQTQGSSAQQKTKRLGTRSLVRIAKRLAKFPTEEKDLHRILGRTLLADFLPPTEKTNLTELLDAAGIKASSDYLNASPVVKDGSLIFPESSCGSHSLPDYSIPLFDPTVDPEGSTSHVPYKSFFYHNSQQSGLMRDIATDIELLGNHVVLLGNQGTGKNAIIDMLLSMLRRPREYIQLHRDTTVNQLMVHQTLEGGVIRYVDSPLLHAVKRGRVLVVDEADKAAEHVVAVFKSLAERGEMSLSDGRRIRPVATEPTDIPVHPSFRMILLANRPGFPFLGNQFLQVLGDAFSTYAVGNPDARSEATLLSQMAPEVDPLLLQKLVGVFQDLRRGFEEGRLAYPFSLRELINLVKHLRMFPDDGLEAALRNIFDFDIHKQETIDFLYTTLRKHRLQVGRLGIESVRDGASEAAKKIKDVSYKPTGSTDLKEPKFGKEDGKEHHGGNTFAGGTGGRDTAGLGGRGGYMRLFKGKDIYQVSDELKNDVPEHLKARAREMAQNELMRKLEELSMSSGEAGAYAYHFNAVEAHIAQLHALLENLEAKEEERIWLKRQADGELDDQRLTDGLTGEATIYKRRASEKPEPGRPQLKPKRIRFVFDASASMYRFQADGRLDRSLECCVMIMEAFARLSRPEKYQWDIVAHCGDSPEITLVESDKLPESASDRFKVIQKMVLTTQYAFAGDYTVLGIEKAVDKVAEVESDDAIVIAVSDANFERYGITPEHLSQAMNRNPKVRTALIAIGEGSEAKWLVTALPQKAYQVKHAHEIPIVLRSILSHMLA